MPSLFSRLAVFGCCFALLTCGSQASAAVVAKAVGQNLADDLNATLTIGTPTGLESLVAASGNWVQFGTNTNNFSDNFGIMARQPSLGDPGEAEHAIDESPALNLMDDSLTIYTPDNYGIIAESDTDNFFGATDLVNPDTTPPSNGNEHGPGQTFTATWAFDITGATGGIDISIDMAAMGDFELRTETGGPFPSPDVLDFEYSFDGTNFSPLFASGITDTSYTNAEDENGYTIGIDLALPGQSIADLTAADPEAIYNIDNGLQVAWNDPLTMDGEPISNEFETLSKSIGAATSSTLSVRFTALTGSSSEVFAFRNITIEDGGAVGLTGDYNGNGTVDAADYTVWRDGDSPDSTIAGYNLWVANFGNSSLATAVPEPATALLLMIGLAGVATRRNG